MLFISILHTILEKMTFDIVISASTILMLMTVMQYM